MRAVTTDESARTHRGHPESLVYVRGQSTSGASLRQRSVYGFGETYGDVCPPPRHHRAPLTAPLPPSPSSWKPLLPFPQCHRVGMTQPLLGLASFTQDHARKTLAILKTKKAKAEGPACSSQDPPPPPAALGQGQCGAGRCSSSRPPPGRGRQGARQDCAATRLSCWTK